MTTAAAATPAADPVPAARASRAAASARGGLRLGISLADQGVVSATNFGTTLVLARLVSEAQLGLYGMAFTGLLLTTEACHALVSTPHQVLLARRGDGERALFNGSALIHTLLFGGIAGTAALGVTAVTGSHVALAFALVAWAVIGRAFARVWCFTTGRPGNALAVDTVASVLQLGGIALLWEIGHLGPGTALLAIGTANFVALAGVLAYRRDEFQPSPRRALVDLRTTWPLSRWVFLSGCAWTLTSHGYPWLVGGLRDAHEAGIWTACFTVAALANPILMGVQNLVGPGVANKAAQDPAGVRRYVSLACFAFGLAMTPYVAFAWFGGEWMLDLVGKGKFEGFGDLVGMLSLATLAQAIGFPASRGLYAFERARCDLWANVIALLVMLGPGSFMIATYGVRGAAGAAVMSLGLGNAYRLFAFFRFTSRGGPA